LATVDKNFKIKNGLIVGDSTNLVNYSSASPSNPFIGQLWINEPYLYAWSSASTWVLVGDGNSGGGGGGSASGTPLNIPNTLVSRNASGVFSIGAVDFDTASTVSSTTARLGWNSSEGTLDLGLSSTKAIHIGEDAVYRVRNSTGSTILKGTALYASGVEPSGRIDVSPYVADGSIREVRFMGLAAENISNGVNGFVQHFGYVTGLDTRGTASAAVSVGDEDWAAGDILYVHPTVPGKLTNIKPQHAITVAIIIKRHQTEGVLFVRPSSGGHLEDIHDINFTTPSDNDLILYDGSASYWYNINLATAIQEVDGSGSGIDADLLDGQHGAYFLNTSSNTQEKTGNITFHGTLTVNELVVSGSSAFIATQDLTVIDSLIFLASEQYTTDGLDIGFIGSYGDGTTSSASYYHASLVRDASENKWKLLSNGPAPVNNVIDYSDPSVEFGVLQLGAIEISSSAKVNNLNADLLDNQDGSYYLDWTNTTNKPDPIIGVALTGNTSGAASVTLTDLNSGQITITTNTTHATTASSMNWSGVTDKPDPIIAVSLSGNTTGAASATLTDLANGQISITTNTAHANTASSINTSLITGTTLPDAIVGSSLTSVGTLTNLSVTNVISGIVASANFAVHALTASSIAGSLVTGPVGFANFALHALTASSIAGSLVTGTVANATNATHADTASSINSSLLTGTTLPPSVVDSSLTSVGTLTNLSVTNVISGRVASANFSLHSLTASSMNWVGITDAPDPIIGVNLTGEVTGAASATLTNLTNGQISITTTIAPDSVILGTDTTGNYVAGATGGNGIIISGTAGEGWSPTITVHSSALTASVSGTSPTGAATVSASTSPGGFRNVFFSTASAGTGGFGNDGDVWLVYV
jgi:hypothetical protein